MKRRLLLVALTFVFSAGVAASAPVLGPASAIPQAPAPASPSKLDLKLPLEQKSVRFAVIGDNGTGGKPEYEIGDEMAAYQKVVGFQFVIMLGDNIYGGHNAKDFERKFEDPYKALLDAGVKFYASLGNHDNSNEVLYKPYNMNGQRYYTFKKGDAEFFVLDSNYMDSTQLDWLQRQLRESNAKWKIAYFHHPLYSDGRFHGPDLDLRKQLLPLFEQYGVNVVFSGHEHVYERVNPQHGIYFFVLGNSGELRYHNLRRPSEEMAAGFDTDRTFMLVELTADKLYFQTISRTGETVDSGILNRQPKPPQPNSNAPQ
jgi:predicted phosphodiesterase